MIQMSQLSQMSQMSQLSPVELVESNELVESDESDVLLFKKYSRLVQWSQQSRRAFVPKMTHLTPRCGLAIFLV